jgi:hypothetical protein
VAIDSRIAGSLGLTTEEAAAAAMYCVINLVMAAGTKDMTLERGVDAAEFLLVYGVAIDSEAWTIDEGETRRLRAEAG